MICIIVVRVEKRRPVINNESGTDSIDKQLSKVGLCAPTPQVAIIMPFIKCSERDLI
jgi:hypothetical protein